MGEALPDDYYALLGVDSGADRAQLRRACRRLALRWHPDRGGPAATTMFQKIAVAYAVLSNLAARKAYDRIRGPPAAKTDRRARPASRRRAPPEMLWRFTGSLESLLASGIARRADGDIVEVLLDPREAAEGGIINIFMPVAVRCLLCSGRRKASCQRCRGKGTVSQLFSAWLTVPPRAPHGALIAPSATLSGMVRPVRFRIRMAQE